MPRKSDSSNPADWLFIAESELEGLRRLAADEVAYIMCVSKLAEVLEKVLKAELIRTGWFLERTHDLLVLARLLEARGSDLLPDVKPLAQSLAGVYFTSRYPGFDLDDPNWPDLRAKLEAVTKLFKRVQERVAAGGS